MIKHCITLLAFVALLLPGCTSIAPNTSTASEALFHDAAIERQVRSDVVKMYSAMRKGDTATILAFTHPKLIAEGGGPQATMRAINQMTALMTSGGMNIESYRVSGPVQLYQTTSNKYAVIPTEMVAELAGQRVRVRSHEVGHLPMGQNRWTYVRKGKTGGLNVRRFFPDFPRGAEPPVATTERLPN